MAEELVKLGHEDMSGTPGANPDPYADYIFAQVDVTTVDNCHVAPKTMAA